ncbi:ATP-dependent DNA helicase [Cryobacterium sp. Hh7]|uniref:UvrD-helicase domain-containing protein n=1 Tax=Cryobacterium sp. Hh7 TaxID=1259159 RepID=UPI00106B188A|nr:UvrD-helicase domain-containing protein [Cryobacterium sp. Hh7]TFD51084.1 ATP-dependent DNA helicase [Cryobacterium sp. Hh7]
MSITLTDQSGRTQIETELDAQLFVQAGAGSGKTHALVSRICALVRRGESLSGIAAITFTEKAAAELRERVRATLENPATELHPDLRERALNELDTAPIGTIHSFATRILSENPIDAGLPPLIEVADALRSRIAFGRRWASARAALFADEQASAALQVLLALGATITQIEAVALGLDSAWDRLDPTPLAEQDLPVMPELDLVPVLNTLTHVLEQAEFCTNPSEDKLYPKMAELRAWRQALVQAKDADDLAAQFDLLTKPPFKNIHVGTAKNWSIDLAALKAELKTLKDETVPQTVSRVVAPAIRRVTAVLGAVLVAEARARQNSGQLEFHDLLVHCRDLLAGVHEDDVKARIHAKYPRIMLDEFQDTDPLQAEIALRIATERAQRQTGSRSELAQPGGSLFMVGDPKQSIYRFRRADIATYLKQQQRSLAANAESVVSLTTNFRSTQPVLDWINHVFAALIVEQLDVQPFYQALDVDPARPAWQESYGPAVTVLGAGEAGLAAAAEMNAAEKRERESADIAAIIQAATATDGTGWTKQAGNRDDFALAPVELQDICILIPTRTSLPALESALDRAGIEYLAEASALVYSTQEVHDLVLVLRAIANTADEAALVLALRTPLFGVGDDDLLVWKHAEGRWSLWVDTPESLSRAGEPAHPVSLALTYLHNLHRDLATSSPADLLTRLIMDRRVLEATTDGPRYRDIWRRLRFVVDQAEAWSEATQGSLRDYVVWADSQQVDNARVNESVVPETGVNAVRITTVHASKGREFPVVILAGSSGGSNNGSDNVLFTPDGQAEVRFVTGLETAGFAALNTSEKQFIEAERLRLLYVACTRAESHLVVSLYQGNKSSAGALLAGAHDPLMSTGFEAAEALPTAAGHRAATVGPVPDWPAWLLDRAHWQATSRHPASVSVSSLAKAGTDAPQLPPFTLRFVQPDPTTPALPTFAGAGAEHGTRLGSAVHKLLELSDITVGPDFSALAVDIAHEFDLADSSTLEALARSAIDAEPVARAAGREHWLELPFAAALDARQAQGTVFESIADLVYREDDDSLVIVDFKTNIGLSAEQMDAYWHQLASYADFIHRATGQTVSEVVLVFCRSDPAQVFRRAAV